MACCNCGVREALKVEFLSEGMELPELFLLDGGLDREGLAFVVGGVTCDQGVEDAGKLAGGGGDAFGFAESDFHPPTIFAQLGIATLKAEGG